MRVFFTRDLRLMRLLTICLLILAKLCASEEQLSGGSLLPQGVTLDLREPTLCNETLCTEAGGVITAPNLRIQGRKIVVTRKMEEDQPQYHVTAEGDLILEYGDYIFTGQKLEYDFITRRGLVTGGHSAIDPWYFSAQEIEVLPSGAYVLHETDVTTSPGQPPDWSLHAHRAYISQNHTLYAKSLTLRLGQIPVFWLPTFQTNLDDLQESPIRYRVRWGGKQGPRFGIIYRAWESERFKGTLRFDYRLSRGPGVAVETEYCDPAHCVVFDTRNLVARDSSISNPNERFRYRLQGLYAQTFFHNRLTLNATYDKVSDQDMPTDYAERDLEIETSGLTQLCLRTQTNFWIASLITRVRANSFETIKEELPTLNASLHPFVIEPLGVISENLLRVGYFDFKYADDLPNIPDFSSTRLEFQHSLYRPFAWKQLNFTPEAGIVAIYYGNDPKHTPIWMVLGTFGAEANTHLYRLYGNVKHVVEPYLSYQYYTFPNTDPTDRYVFDIHDGWYYLNTLRVGWRNFLYYRPDTVCPIRCLSADLYTYAFFHTNKIAQTIPRLFGDLNWELSPRLRYSLASAWSFEHNNIDHINQRVEWTIGDHLALAAEYRHRSSFCWRKADPENFMLDFFRSEEELRNSSLSDRRDTVLLHTYWRVQHNLAFEFRLRRGWNRLTEPDYTEYQFDILKTMRSSWFVKLSYQHREDDHRIAFYFSIGMKKPKSFCCPLNCVTD